MYRLLPFAASLLLWTGAAVAQDDDDTPSLNDIPHITMTGTAHVEVRPDLATITLGVETERPTAKAAAAENAKMAQAVIDAAKADGVPAIDIATQTVTLTQTFDMVKDPGGTEIRRKPRGYAAHNNVAIKLRDLAKAGAIAEDLIGEGANRFDGIVFSVEHPEPIIDKLVGAAVKNARGQAEIAVEAAGVKLGRVLLIERPSDGDAPHPYTRNRLAAAAAPAPAPIEVGTASYSTAINVTWALDQK